MFSYFPVLRTAAGSYSGAALVSTYSTSIGWSLNDPGMRQGLLGFAIRKTVFDNATNEQLELKWIGGFKRFKETDEGGARMSAR